MHCIADEPQESTKLGLMIQCQDGRLCTVVEICTLLEKNTIITIIIIIITIIIIIIIIIIPREEGRRGLISVEDCVESATLGLERYINDSD